MTCLKENEPTRSQDPEQSSFEQDQKSVCPLFLKGSKKRLAWDAHGNCILLDSPYGGSRKYGASMGLFSFGILWILV